MKNIVLIGMPAVGKSTIGVLLAKAHVMSFVDTDLLIQKKYNKSLCEIIEENGTKTFIEIENRIIFSEEFENSVIATGGSAIYGEQAMKKLRENGTVVYLSLSSEVIKKRIGDIKSRGVVMANGSTVEEIFNERKPLYEKYADFVIDCNNLSVEECVEKIIFELNKQ